MALKNPPIQDRTLEQNGRFRRTWIAWFQSIARESREGYTGTFMDAMGNTVTIENGKITDIS